MNCRQDAGIAKAADGRELKVDRPAPNAPSVIYDAVVIPGGSAEILAKQALVVQFVREAFCTTSRSLPLEMVPCCWMQPRLTNLLQV